MELQIIPFGDWQGLVRRSATLGIDIRGAAKWGQDKAAQKLIKIVKNHIENSDLPSLIAKKNPRYGHDDRPLIDTGNYLQNITKWRENLVLLIGVKSSIYEPSGIPTSVLAMWLEEGTKNIPARPVWGPSIEEMGGVKGINEIVGESIYRSLIRKGWDFEF